MTKRWSSTRSDLSKTKRQANKDSRNVGKRELQKLLELKDKLGGQIEQRHHAIEALQNQIVGVEAAMKVVDDAADPAALGAEE